MFCFHVETLNWLYSLKGPAPTRNFIGVYLAHTSKQRPEENWIINLCVVYFTSWRKTNEACWHLLHIWAGHHSTSDPTGTSVTRSPPARSLGSTGRWRRCRGWGRGGTCSSSRWRSRAARNMCRSSAPLFDRRWKIEVNSALFARLRGRKNILWGFHFLCLHRQSLGLLCGIVCTVWTRAAV